MGGFGVGRAAGFAEGRVVAGGFGVPGLTIGWTGRPGLGGWAGGLLPTGGRFPGGLYPGWLPGPYGGRL